MRRFVSKPVVVIAIFLAGLACGVASAAQVHYSHMQIALADLQAARYQLSLAPIDIAGHRGSAIGMLDGAIEQVRLGLESH
ncbi:MAG TPA: hypothetical protein VN905_09485 [Candidatus Binatia bacterium]|nr:hypothetical protein [Candidatus Binatia bacterium]